MSVTQTNAAKLINDVKKEKRSRNASPTQTTNGKTSKIAMMGKTHSPSGALYKDRSASGQIIHNTDKERKNSSNNQ